jgi:SEC-C motif
VGVKGIEDRYGIFKRLMAELEEVPPEVLPPDEREFTAQAWAIGAVRKGYKTIEEILDDRGLKARLLDDFDDEAADERLKVAMATQPCPCGSGKKYKKCCLQ